MFLKSIYARMVIFITLVCAGLVWGLESILGVFVQNIPLNSLIMLITAVGIVMLFRQFLQFLPEIRWLLGMQEPQDKKLPSPKLLKLLDTFLSDQKMNLAPSQVQSVMDNLENRMSEQRERSKYFIGVTVFLGLLGTFWGLAQTLQSVSQVIMAMPTETSVGASFLNQLKQGLMSPLSGMGIAFSSSLFGLVGSLILGFLEFQVHQARSRFLNYLDQWLSTYTLKNIQNLESREPQSFSLIQSLLGQTAETLDSMQTGIRSLQDQSQGVTNALHHLSENLARLVDQRFTEHNILLKVAESLVAFQNTNLEFKQAITENKFGVDESTAHHIRSLDNATYRLIDAITQGQASLARELRNEIRILSRTLASIAESELQETPAAASTAKPRTKTA